MDEFNLLSGSVRTDMVAGADQSRASVRFAVIERALMLMLYWV